MFNNSGALACLVSSGANCPAVFATLTSTAITGTTINATTGFQLNGAATSGNVLRGNGTNFVNAQLGLGDIAAGTAGTGTWDFSGASHTLPALKGTTAGKPATCTLGEMYFSTDATAGQNWFFCTATNTWTQQLNTGGAGAAFTNG